MATCKERYIQEHPGYDFTTIPLTNCPSDYGYLDDPDLCYTNEPADIKCTECWNREIPVKSTDENKSDNSIYSLSEECNKAAKDGIEALTEQLIDDYKRGKKTLNEVRKALGFVKVKEPHILDSGTRREFESGAVRDIQEGKGRCDLLPLDVVAEFLVQMKSINEGYVIYSINEFTTTGDFTYLITALDAFCKLHNFEPETMLLEVSKHFEEGCNKYGENNWQKGIPVHCYIDSAVRHYLKFLREDTDEPHDRAFCWNILCAIWTCKHKPELNPYGEGERSGG